MTDTTAEEQLYEREEHERAAEHHAAYCRDDGNCPCPPPLGWGSGPEPEGRHA